ncbi:MAG: AAA family ATPase [Candidatus Brocadiales bacterium]
MTSNISVLIIESDKSECESLKKTLDTFKGGIVVAEAADIESGYQQIQKTKPLIVIFGLPEVSEPDFLMIERIAREFPETNILVKSKDKRPETVIKAIRAGAKDFLLDSSSNGELHSAIKKIIRQKEGDTDKDSKIITVFSGKGGVGTTMITTNLAINLTQITSKSVVLVDLNLQFGNINMYLDVRSFSTISDLISNFHRLDQALLHGSLARHPSGVCILSAPKELEDGEMVTSEQITKILNLLQESFDYVIIDMPHYFGEYHLPALDLAESIILVSSPLLPSIRNTQRGLSIFKQLGVSVEKVKLIINRYIKQSEVTLKEIEDTLDCSVFWMIPNDTITVTTSINRGEPISIVAPRSEINTSLMRLASKFVEESVPTPKKQGRGLFGLIGIKE